MKNIISAAFLLIVFTMCNKDYQATLEKANVAYGSGKKDEAKLLYAQAAKNGSAEAHFILARKFDMPDDEEIHHYSEAAKLGHQKALEYILDVSFLEPHGLLKADPVKALEIYEAAKKKNPSIELYSEEDKVDVLKKCAEAAPLDAKEFVRKYDISEDIGLENDIYGMYSIWELAEEASRGGRFGEPDPLLTLQLIMRGSPRFVELKQAVNDFYDHWKNGVVKEFDICDYALSTPGMQYCSERDHDASVEEQEDIFDAISSKLKPEVRELLDKAYSSAVSFIETKAWNEEGHDGTGYQVWAMESIAAQKTAYLHLVDSINSGFIPDINKSFANSDQSLNETYLSVIKKLKEKPISGVNFKISPREVKTVQRLWAPYRDASVALFTAIDLKVNAEVWKVWLTETRIQELNSILEMEDM